MKNLIYISLSILVISCSTTKNANTSKSSSIDTEKAAEQVKTIVVPYVLEKAEEIVSKSSIKKNLEYLASDELEGRNTGTPGIEKAAVYIENFFKDNNVKPYFETYRDSFNIKDIVGYNIVGMVEGNDAKLKNEIVILGAHYDHIGNGKEVDGDVIANGANDDASGTVVVMEWAKYFAKTKSNKRTVLFTLYSAEEMGLKGSAHLAKVLKEKNIDLYTMLNIEMAGVPRSSDVEMAYITGYDRSNFAATVNKYAKENILGFFPKAKEFQLFKRSDNYPFYNEFKVPAQAISTFDFTNFNYYHHVDDEADKMDFDHMTNFTLKLLKGLQGVINSPSKEVVLNNE